MAKIKITRNVCFVESQYALDTIEKLAKYAPQALTVKDEDGNVTFRGATGKGNGSLTAAGVCYGEQADKSKSAAIMLTIPTDIKDPKAWVMENIGTNLLKLNQLEAQYEAALKTVDEELAAVVSAITVD